DEGGPSREALAQVRQSLLEALLATPQGDEAGIGPLQHPRDRPGEQADALLFDQTADDAEHRDPFPPLQPHTLCQRLLVPYLPPQALRRVEVRYEAVGGRVPHRGVDAVEYPLEIVGTGSEQ